jgi:hypothetical protein
MQERKKHRPEETCLAQAARLGSRRAPGPAFSLRAATGGVVWSFQVLLGLVTKDIIPFWGWFAETS